MKGVIPGIMAQILAIYGLIIAMIIFQKISPANEYSAYAGYSHLAAGLTTGLCSLGAGLRSRPPTSTLPTLDTLISLPVLPLVYAHWELVLDLARQRVLCLRWILSSRCRSYHWFMLIGSWS